MTSEQAAMALRLTEAARAIVLVVARTPNEPTLLAAVKEIMTVVEQMTRKPTPVIFDPRQAAIAGVQ